MSLEEEEIREEVAKEIEYLLQIEYGVYPECDVEVFGSSKSLYGSMDSDLDMCVLTNGYCRAFDDDRVQMSTAETIEQLKKTQSQVLEAVRRLYSSKDPKQQQTIDFFDAQMQLLLDILGTELDQWYWEARSRRGATKTPQTALNEKMLRISKRRKNELFDLKSIFENEPGFEIQAVASHACVPVIRFRYTQGGLDYKCDLSFDNELGVRNTQLLRAYASFDDRARELGLAVKHWAKQRGITDTASGFLSSYSYVLLSIYYLQIVHVLPNLQDPQLLTLAEVLPVYYEHVNTAFCEDRDIAAIFHEQNTANAESTDASLPALLMGFFEFYASQFDCVNRVVAIRSPEKLVLKASQWKVKAKSWRMSTQDPLQTSRDVGGVLHFSGQRKITHELRRAFEMLERGESFLGTVCSKQQEL